MQKAVSNSPTVKPVWLIILAAGTIVGLAMGLRQVMGLYLQPMTTELKIGREPFSNAMAIANLVWGIGAIFAGAIADKYGAGRVIVVVHARDDCRIARHVQRNATARCCIFRGLLLGLGVAGTGITALVGAVGRAVPAEKRTAAIASLGMAGGIGGFIAFPYAHLAIQYLDGSPVCCCWRLRPAIMIPMAIPLSGKPTAPPLARSQH